MKRKSELIAFLAFGKLVRDRMRVICDTSGPKVGGRSFQYSDTAEVAAGIFYMYSLAMSKGDLSRLSQLVHEVWPTLLQRTSALNGGQMHYDSTAAAAAAAAGVVVAKFVSPTAIVGLASLSILDSPSLPAPPLPVRLAGRCDSCSSSSSVRSTTWLGSSTHLKGSNGCGILPAAQSVRLVNKASTIAYRAFTSSSGAKSRGA